MFVQVVPGPIVLAQVVPGQELEAEILDVSDQEPEESHQLQRILTGIKRGNRIVLSAVFVKGLENADGPVDFENWLVPLDDLITGLDLQVKPTHDNALEVRSPNFVLRLNQNDLTQDPELGQVMSIRQIQETFQVPASFDLRDYVIHFEPDWLEPPRGTGERPPVIVEGLPIVAPPPFGLGTINQRTNLTGRVRGSDQPTSLPISLQTGGELEIQGSLGSGTWLLNIRQHDLQDMETWQLDRAQYLRFTPDRDFAIGFQPSFWQRQTSEAFWGLTTIQRFGFEPTQLYSPRLQPEQRLRDRTIAKTITGAAPPGTLVQLVESNRDQVLAETLVDSRGTYHFEDVPAYLGSVTTYRLFFYEGGILTQEPEIQTRQFLSTPEQLDVGNSVLITSFGLGHRAKPDLAFLGELGNLTGGMLWRRGLSESLTFGVGTVYDRGGLGLGELFYQVPHVPVTVTANALMPLISTPESDLEQETELGVQMRPSRNLSINFNSDIQDARTHLNWKPLPGITLLASHDTRSQGLGFGTSIRTTINDFSIVSRTSWDPVREINSNTTLSWREWSWNQRFRDRSRSSQFNYKISDSPHGLSIAYDTRNQEASQDWLIAPTWQYQPNRGASNGRFNRRSNWQLGIGYGIGSRGTGPILSASTQLIPGFNLIGSYQGTSLTSDNPSFRINITSGFRAQNGLKPIQFNNLIERNLGGLKLKLVLDKNQNQAFDPGETLYTEDLDLLLRINDRPINPDALEIQRNTIVIPLRQGTHRLDLDPGGYPFNWVADTTAYAIRVNQNLYSTWTLFLQPIYTIVGKITNPQGKPLADLSITAVDLETQTAISSTTNAGGIYYLHKLAQGPYQITINQQPIPGQEIVIGPDSEPLIELNLTYPP